jgi:nucleoside-diphosphate-sugar epimerase
LLDRGHEVHVLLRSLMPSWRLRSVWDRLYVHQADLTNAAATRAAVQAARPAAVLHLATHGAYESQSDPRAILGTNVFGTYNLLESAGEAGVRAFVSTGSSSEYGFKLEPMREIDRLDPNSYYAVAKATQTHLCAYQARRGAMGVAVYRLFSVYGPWEEPTRLIPTLLRRARAGLPLEMAPAGVARDFVFVGDVIEALLDLPRAAGLRGEVVYLGSGVEVKLRDVAAAVLAVTGSRSEVRWGAFPVRHWDTTRWCADLARAREVLGWSARTSFYEGLRRTAAWWESTGEGAHAPELSRAAG